MDYIQFYHHMNYELVKVKDRGIWLRNVIIRQKCTKGLEKWVYYLLMSETHGGSD